MTKSVDHSKNLAPEKKSKFWFWIWFWIWLWIVTVIAIMGLVWSQLNQKEEPPIKVGILHSLTGTMAISERSLVDMVLLEIEEINQKGGLLGRKIEPIVVDGKSDWSVFAKEAERLIVEEKVSVIFGCWTSACRKTVKPIFEKYDHLLIYPVQYEGLEESPNIVYTGAAPNQQITPAVKWAFDNLGKKFFLVGSDYVFPRTANEIIKDQVIALGGEIVGEEYVLLGGSDFDEISQKIIETQPDVVLNTVNGDSNIYFFDSLHHVSDEHQVMLNSEVLPIISFSIAEEELRTLKETLRKQVSEQLGDVDQEHLMAHIESVWNMHIVGNYAAWNYFQSIDVEQNKQFVERFKKRHGQDRVIGDPMEAAYLSVHLWAEAVKDASTDSVEVVRQVIKGECLLAPEGIACVDSKNNHTWKTVRIGKINKNGQFDIVWSSKKPIHPDPYPASRSKTEWNQFLENLYISWDNSWANFENTEVD